jgi:hypothetical protein
MRRFARRLSVLAPALAATVAVSLAITDAPLYHDANLHLDVSWNEVAKYLDTGEGTPRKIARVAGVINRDAARVKVRAAAGERP